MKKVLSFALMAVFMFISCSKTDEQDFSNENQSLEALLAEIAKTADETGKAVSFDVKYIEGQFIKENVSVVDNVSMFVPDFADTFNGTSSTARIQIECSNGTTTYCGDSDGACVGAAVKACLDGGGCATVCSTRMLYIPKQTKE